MCLPWQALAPYRIWNETRFHSVELWNLCKEANHLAVFDLYTKSFGVRDGLNASFVKTIQGLHSKKVPQVSIDEAHLEMTNDHMDEMFNPFLRLIGKLGF